MPWQEYRKSAREYLSNIWNMNIYWISIWWNSSTVFFSFFRTTRKFYSTSFASAMLLASVVRKNLMILLIEYLFVRDVYHRIAPLFIDIQFHTVPDKTGKALHLLFVAKLLVLWCEWRNGFHSVRRIMGGTYCKCREIFSLHHQFRIIFIC